MELQWNGDTVQFNVLIANIKKAVVDSTRIEQLLRREWWLHHGHEYSAMYGDDGEMQCQACPADFLRQPLDELEKIVFDARLKNAVKLSSRYLGMDKVIVSAYKADDGKEVPEHIIDVPTAEEILDQGKMNIANTTEAIRRRVTMRLNGGSTA